MRTLPNMTVIAPCDYYSARALVRKAVEKYGPVYMRFTRDPIPYIYEGIPELEIGKAHQLHDGNDVAIIANGDIMSFPYEAVKILEKEGIHTRLIDMHTIKPLDVQGC